LFAVRCLPQCALLSCTTLFRSSATIARIGEPAWKGLYTLVSIIGLVVMIYGYGAARVDPTVLWVPPAWGRHVTALLSLVAFVLRSEEHTSELQSRENPVCRLLP